MALKYSRVDRLSDGFLVDPRAYVEMLPGMNGSLPVGAYSFVSDPEHYNFFSERSIKDLKVERLQVVDGFAKLGVVLDLTYNRLPNVPRLSIQYRDVSNLSIDVRSKFQVRADWVNEGIKRMGDILTDEIHPDPHGCIHVIELIHGEISVTCADLEAVWS
jgi:hypothetical protein